MRLNEVLNYRIFYIYYVEKEILRRMSPLFEQPGENDAMKER